MPLDPTEPNPALDPMLDAILAAIDHEPPELRGRMLDALRAGHASVHSTAGRRVIAVDFRPAGIHRVVVADSLGPAAESLN